MSRQIMFFKLSATIIVYFSIQVSNAFLRGSGIWFWALRCAQGEQGRQCTYVTLWRVRATIFVVEKL